MKSSRSGETGELAVLLVVQELVNDLDIVLFFLPTHQQKTLTVLFLLINTWNVMKSLV